MWTACQGRQSVAPSNLRGILQRDSSDTSASPSRLPQVDFHGRNWGLGGGLGDDLSFWKLAHGQTHLVLSRTVDASMVLDPDDVAVHDSVNIRTWCCCGPTPAE